MSPTITANGVISIRSRLNWVDLCGSAFSTKMARNERHGRRCVTCFQNARARRSVRSAGDTMPTMKKFAVLLLALLGLSVAAAAQEYSDDPYEFILAKLAADDGRFDEALS